MTNSDPGMILFMVGWLRDVFNIAPKVLRAWLNIYPQQNESQLKTFCESTGIPLDNFVKSFIKPVSRNYKKTTFTLELLKFTFPAEPICDIGSMAGFKRFYKKTKIR